MFHPLAQTSVAIVRYAINGVSCENVVHYLWNNTTPPTEAELLTLATEVWGTIATKLMLLSHSAVIMKEVYARNMHVEVANQATYGPTPPIGGVRTGTKVQNQVAKSITKRTGLTGRSQHGGFRISGFDISELDRDFITSTLVTLIANLILSILANRVGGRFIPAVGSNLLGHSNTMRQALLNNNIVGSTDSRTQTPT